MPITPEQRLKRRNHIGSSDAAAILGLNPYGKNASSVWCEKMYGTDDLPNEGPIQLGNELEPIMIRWAESELGVEIKTDVSVVAPDGICAANHDGLVVPESSRHGIEAKSTGLMMPYNVAEQFVKFGDPMTSEVPIHVEIQCLFQMYVSNLDRVWVPAWTHKGKRMYFVDRDEKKIRDIIDACLFFWETYVRPGTPPLDFRPDLDTVKRIKREPETPVEVDYDAWAALIEAKENLRAAEKAEEDAKAKVLGLIGTGDGVTVGRKIVATYHEVVKNPHTVKGSRYRTMRIMK